jgi:Fe-S-cluster containining protein
MPPALPCQRCPHGSACCFHGTSVTDEERDAIRREHGPAFLRFNAAESVWRTALRNGRCVFLSEQGCQIHAKSYYPEVCRGFPFYAGKTQEPYAFPVDECGEFALREDLRPLFDAATGKLRVLA